MASGGKVASTAGSIIDGIGSLMQGEEQSAAYKYQSKVAQQNAQQARDQGAFDASRMMVFADQKIGAQVAGYAASGVETNTGSPLSVIQSSHATAELDRMNILHGADIKAINFENQASIDSIAADNAMTAGYIGLVSGIVGGSGKFAGSSAQPSSPSGSTDQEGNYAGPDDFATVGGSVG